MGETRRLNHARHLHAWGHKSCNRTEVMRRRARVVWVPALEQSVSHVGLVMPPPHPANAPAFSWAVVSKRTAGLSGWSGEGAGPCGLGKRQGHTMHVPGLGGTTSREAEFVGKVEQSRGGLGLEKARAPNAFPLVGALDTRALSLPPPTPPTAHSLVLHTGIHPCGGVVGVLVASQRPAPHEHTLENTQEKARIEGQSSHVPTQIHTHPTTQPTWAPDLWSFLVWAWPPWCRGVAAGPGGGGGQGSRGAGDMLFDLCNASPTHVFLPNYSR